MIQTAEQIDQVKIKLKANIHFDGKVVSHTLFLPDGSRKTVGVIFPGSYKFNTDAAERMDVISGHCRARQAGRSEWQSFAPGDGFNVPAKSSFEIAVDQGLAEYLCSFE